jgi:predicted nucleotidyltransferase
MPELIQIFWKMQYSPDYESTLIQKCKTKLQNKNKEILKEVTYLIDEYNLHKHFDMVREGVTLFDFGCIE